MKPANSNVQLTNLEEEILAKWESENTFAAQNQRRQNAKTFSFYDGPPFANGLPHYGHLLANTIKDTVTRYWIMHGYQVHRRFGWDCHGLPVENEIEKLHNLKGAVDIEEFGVSKFNEECRKIVLRYASEWQEIISRLKSVGQVRRLLVGLTFSEGSVPESGWELLDDENKKIGEVTSVCSTDGELIGLGYIKIGQQATTLSGGEAQRIKLAKELSKRSTGRTMYILDEPTTGLHQHDIKKLLEILHTFVATGNTVVVIEHNLDVIKTADYIVDMGPEGGVNGGNIIAEGKPEEVAKIETSYTGKFLKPLLDTKYKKIA